jgi:hypothetical protein
MYCPYTHTCKHELRKVLKVRVDIHRPFVPLLCQPDTTLHCDGCGSTFLVYCIGEERLLRCFVDVDYLPGIGKVFGRNPEVFFGETWLTSRQFGIVAWDVLPFLGIHPEDGGTIFLTLFPGFGCLYCEGATSFISQKQPGYDKAGPQPLRLCVCRGCRTGYYIFFDKHLGYSMLPKALVLESDATAEALCQASYESRAAKNALRH